jgi:hypothetical protein
VTMFGRWISDSGPFPTTLASGGLSDGELEARARSGEAESERMSFALSCMITRAPERICRIRLPWANEYAISRDGARWFECILFARMTALKDSNASVANKAAGPNRRMWSMTCSII